MTRNRYRVVRRGQKWMVRTPRPGFGQNELWELSKEPGVIKYKTVCYLNLSLQQLMLQQGEYLLLIGLPQSQTDFITHGIFNACIIFS